MRLNKHFWITLLVSASLCGCLVLLIRWYDYPSGQFDDEQLSFIFTALSLMQLTLVLVLTALITGFLHRVAEPYLILWTLASWAWIAMFGAQLFYRLTATSSELLTGIEDLFNNLNSILFLLAALAALQHQLPERLRRQFRTIPSPPTRPFGNILAWLFEYARRNRLAGIMLSLPVVAFLFSLAPCPVLPIPEQFGQTIASCLALLLLGVALYLRVLPISPLTAAACLLVHVVYLAPQISHGLAAVPGPSMERLAVFASALVLKPSLYLFIVLVALREMSNRRDLTAQAGNTRLHLVLEQLARASLFVQWNSEERTGVVIDHNALASDLLGSSLQPRMQISKLFDSATDLIEDLLESEGRTIRDHDAEVVLPAAGGVPPAEIPIRVDAMRLEPAEEGATTEEILMFVRPGRRLEAEVTVAFAVHNFIARRLRRIGQTTNKILTDGLKPSERNALLEEVGGLAREGSMAAESIRNAAVDHIKRVKDNYRATCSLRQCITASISHTERTHASTSRHVAPPAFSVEGLLSEDGAELTVAMPRTALTQVLQSLLMNAVDATHRRGVSGGFTPIEIETSRHGLAAIVRISGRARPFPPELVHAINTGKLKGLATAGLGTVCTMLYLTAWDGTFRVGNEKSGTWVELTIPLPTESEPIWTS